jgi:hypothetical protein
VEVHLFPPACCHPAALLSSKRSMFVERTPQQFRVGGMCGLIFAGPGCAHLASGLPSSPDCPACAARHWPATWGLPTQVINLFNLWSNFASRSMPVIPALGHTIAPECFAHLECVLHPLHAHTKNSQAVEAYHQQRGVVDVLVLNGLLPSVYGLYK